MISSKDFAELPSGNDSVRLLEDLISYKDSDSYYKNFKK